MGVIDSLSAGFDLVRRRPWLILLPAALDIALWVGPKLSVVSLVRGLVADLSRAMAVAGPGALQTFQEQGRLLEQLAESVDLATLLVSSYLGVPSVAVSGATSFFGFTKQVVELRGGLGLLGLAIALVLAGLLIATLYLGLIAQQARDKQIDWPALIRRLPRYWLRLIGAGLVAIIGLVLFSFPVAVMVSLLGLLNQGLASLLMGMLLFGGFWIIIYLVFVPAAILFSEDGALRAIGRSFLIVRANFWPVLWLYLLVNVITAGLMFIWQRLASTAPGAVLAIAANGYIGTGLTAALFIFYRERLHAASSAPKAQRSQA